jgi:hypothetical protein
MQDSMTAPTVDLPGTFDWWHPEPLPDPDIPEETVTGLVNILRGTPAQIAADQAWLRQFRQVPRFDLDVDEDLLLDTRPARDQHDSFHAAPAPAVGSGWRKTGGPTVSAYAVRWAAEVGQVVACAALGIYGGRQLGRWLGNRIWRAP